MKLILNLLLFLLPMVILAQAPTNNLIGYWPLDGSMDDMSAYENSGTTNGGAYQLDRFGNFRSAYQFSSKTDYILLDSTLGPLTQWTVSFWAYDYGSKGSIALSRTGRENAIRVRRPGFTDNVNRIDYSWNGDQGSIPVETSETKEKWSFFVFCTDGDTVHLYLDGLYKGYRIPSDASLTVGRIGSDRSDGNYTLYGILDEIRIYNTRLSDNQMQRLLATNYETPLPGLYAKNSNIGISTSNPSYSLDVGGTARAMEIIVEIEEGTGPDYVFETDYSLPSLDFLSDYINKYKHLPEVPTARDMEKNGLQLGEMNIVVLKKIEELTLYIIQQQKQLNAQNEELQGLQRQLEMMRD